jgi:hypothetical protein
VRFKAESSKLVLSLLVVLACAIPARAQLEKPWQLDLETGPIFVARNDVQVPRDSTGTRFSLCRYPSVSDIGISLRARLTYAISDRHKVSIFAQPLTVISDAYDTTGPIEFYGKTFPKDTLLTATYRFDTYRLTYRYDFISRQNLEAGIGITALLRDAAITMHYDGGETTKTNTGFVPLINFRVNWMLNDFIGALLEGDALAAPQGRAEDVTAAVQFQPKPNLKLRLGYRLLEGGAEVSEVFNLALLHYIALGATVSF